MQLPAPPTPRSARSCVLALCCTLSAVARADEQRDPELKELLQKIIGSRDCFARQVRLRGLVQNHGAASSRASCPRTRSGSTSSIMCTARRSATRRLQLPPDLVLALIEVESRFDPLGRLAGRRGRPHAGDAVLAARARRAESVGARRAQYPHGLRDSALTTCAPRTTNWSRALARYNGSAGRNTYPALVMQRWQRVWRF